MSVVLSSKYTIYVYQTALAALRAGISCVPILPDGSKSPAVRWKEYQCKKPTLADVKGWFQHSESGIAFITGQVSGGLEMIDFDTHEVYDAWAERMRSEGQELLLERVERGYKEESPNGVHLFVRSRVAEGNKKLARRFIPESERLKSLIETRGDGGYGLVAPSGGNVHPSGRPYRLIQGDVSTILTVTPSERTVLFDTARIFNEMPPIEAPSTSFPPSMTHERIGGGRRPGDIFNERATWEEILSKHGWEFVRSVGEESQWRRPGKDEGVSATTNYKDSDLLYVFSTSTIFESERGYSKFSAYTLLEHNGDFSAAAKVLAEKGYIEQEEGE